MKGKWVDKYLISHPTTNDHWPAVQEGLGSDRQVCFRGAQNQPHVENRAAKKEKERKERKENHS